jgi:hypothetical protein
MLGSNVKLVVFVKHGAGFDFAWFHDNNISDCSRGNKNLWWVLIF